MKKEENDVITLPKPFYIWVFQIGYAYINCKSFYGKRNVDGREQNYADAAVDEGISDYKSIWG